jgi:phage regulator Rha-like protein
MPNTPSETEITIIPVEQIGQRIYLIRGVKVILDADLAALYQVETRILIQAVNRNIDRFPSDFMFQLTQEEARSLRSQIVTSKKGRGGRRYLPYAFTEHGVAMLSSVLNSKRAVQMNILIIRAFVKLRELLASNKDLAARLEKLERSHEQHASVINILAEEIDTLKQLPPEPERKPIGFVVPPDEAGE